MEKTRYYEQVDFIEPHEGSSDDNVPRRTSPRFVIATQTALLLFILCIGQWQHIVSYFQSTYDPGQQFLADKTQAIGTVKWWRCTGVPDDSPLDCGYLIAPLDYFNESAGVAYIALSRYRATAKPRKGSILFNPGGPGGSGKASVITRGAMLQHLLGEQYDVIGFDPRGIGETLPSTRCFTQSSSADFKRNTVLARSYDLPSNISRAEARTILVQQQRDADALQKTQFAVCKKSMGDELRYMGTSTVVRDIDFITKQLEGEDTLINFFGGSYGTILGQYLVNMLPDRIGRVAIDGVADAVAWSSKPYYQWYKQWLSSTNDAYQIFLDRCAAVGPNACALAKAKGDDPDDLEARIEEFIDSLYFHPLDVPDASEPDILTSGRARMFLLTTLQRPIQWRDAAHAFAEAMKGNGTEMLNSAVFGRYSDLQRSAVSCNDNRPFAPPSAEEVIDEALDVFYNVSRLVFGAFTTEPDAGCQYWPVTPPERFEGPWNKTLQNPILVVSNTADPVTPISSGLMVQKLLGNSSRLLVQDGPGHCSLAMPSECTINAYRSFFADGTLPPPGTVCQTDYLPFAESDVSSLSEEEARRFSDYALLSDVFQ